MAKTFSLSWVYEPLENHITFLTKRMFGGLAVYIHGRMVMVLMENPGDREYRGEVFPFDVWNGVLLPMERSSHESLQREFPELVSHPVLGKWLYLPMSSPPFEMHMERIAQLIRQDDLRFGIYPKERRERKVQTATVKKKTAAKKPLSKKMTSKKVATKKKKKAKTKVNKKTSKKFKIRAVQ